MGINLCQTDRKAVLRLAGITESRVLLMTGSVDCKDHSHSEGGQQREPSAGGEAGAGRGAGNK